MCLQTNSQLELLNQLSVRFGHLHALFTQVEATLTRVACVTHIKVKEGVSGNSRLATLCSVRTRGLSVSSECSNAHWQVELFNALGCDCGQEPAPLLPYSTPQPYLHPTSEHSQCCGRATGIRTAALRHCSSELCFHFEQNDWMCPHSKVGPLIYL